MEDDYSFYHNSKTFVVTQTSEQPQRHHQRQRLIKILQKTKSVKRSNKTINELVVLLQQEQLFQPIANNIRVLSKVADKIQYVYFHNEKVIYDVKETSEYFYILLSGNVALSVPEQMSQQPNQQEAVSRASEEERSSKNNFNSFLQMRNPCSTPSIEKPLIHVIQDRIIRNITQGGCFGQIIKPGSLRQTKAVAKQECHALRLDYQAYQILLQAQVKTQFHMRYHFLQQIPLFQQLTSFSLSRICQLMSEEHLIYGQSLYRCGNPIRKIYIIRKGDFKLVRRIQRYSITRMMPKIEHKIVKESKKDAEYLIVQDGEVLGDAQTIENIPKYQQSCLCESQEATVLAIDQKTFLQILLEEEETTFQAVSQTIKNKNRWKNTLVNSFVDRRTRNSKMNYFLNDPQRSFSQVKRKREQSGIQLKQHINPVEFFYNEFNQTINLKTNNNRFSVSKEKCKTEANKAINLFSVKTKKKSGIPHGIEDIIHLVKQKKEFQQRFRNDKKIKYLFKFNKDDAPLYVKNKFGPLK